ncbi:MAG: DUF1538 domain-containing protein [Clostridiales bacterium]|nr:DUF1538 domain-containing protein [Clostridiales bacterium]
MGKVLMSKIKEALFSVLPVAAIVLIMSFTPLVEVNSRERMIFILSALFLVLGIGLFNLGADLAMTPMGENVGVGLTKSKKLSLLLVVCFIMGVLITVAEPDLSVLAEQVGAVINSTLLIVTVGVGVGLFLLIAILKIVFKGDLSALLIFFYLMLFAITTMLIESGNGSYLPLGFDSGGVTTGPITVPFIMALGVGVAATIGGKKSKENSFGLVALCSIGPILAVMMLALTSSGSPIYELPAESYSFGTEVSAVILHSLKAVAQALGLIVLFFFVLQFTVLKLPRKKIIQIIVGIVYTFVGLVMFLSAVEIGFMPMGFKIGQQIANSGSAVLIVFGFIIGLVVVLAEPAVHVLNNQVEEITGGAVKKRSMLIALSVGVGVSIALAMIRIVYRFSLLYYVIPGYLISLGLSFFVPKIYTAIAFDSGGVASGPLTSSFILPLAIGACEALCGVSEVMSFAFGVVALVAMTPLITIQALGFRAVVTEKVHKKLTMRRILRADDEQIINFM